MSHPVDQSQPDINQRARQAADATVLRLARDDGAEIRTRPIYRGAGITVSYAEPAAGLRAARSLEIAATRQARDYVRHAREEGMTWGHIGNLLGLSPDLAAKEGYDAGRAAFDYAAGTTDGRPGWSYEQSFRWTCPSCEKTVTDRGPEAGRPEDAEPGHSPGCALLAARSAAYDAEWEAGQ